LNWKKVTGNGADAASRRIAWAWTGLAWLPLVLVAYSLVVCAWQSDDAFITFRTVKNAWEGHGLTWNPGERVQSYTHPLWMMVGLLCYGVAHELYFSTLAVSLILALAAAAMVARSAGGERVSGFLALALLASSGAFIDYSTSGLETALLAFLLVLFALVVSDERRTPEQRFTLLGAVAAAIGLTRLDALAMVLPAMAFAGWRVMPRRRAAPGLLAWAGPLAAWELFSLIYYGSLVPNTALAKLNVLIPRIDLLRQAGFYYLDSLRHDPATLVTIAAAIGLVAWRGPATSRLLAAGIGLYLVYVVSIGGDFMSGRFFVAACAVAAALLASALSRWRRERAWPTGASVLAPACVVCFLALWPHARWRSGADFGADFSVGDVMGHHGIADERAYYYPSTGLLRVLGRWKEIREKGLPIPPTRNSSMGEKFARSAEPARPWGQVGFFGYFSGEKFIVDKMALCEPFLARIPYQPEKEWRIGHFERPFPAGFLESRQKGRTLISDPELAAAYDAVVLVTEGPLFDAARWREVWRVNTGFYAQAFARAAREPGVPIPPMHELYRWKNR
jgi:arabinofuranosyltransferase